MPTVEEILAELGFTGQPLEVLPKICQLLGIEAIGNVTISTKNEDTGLVEININVPVPNSGGQRVTFSGNIMVKVSHP